MATFYVWDKSGQYKEIVYANSADEAVDKAKLLLNIHAPMVQERWSFVETHQIKNKITEDYAVTRQQLRYADIKTAENRTWRDKEYN